MGELILIDFKNRRVIDAMTLEEKRRLVIEYYEDAYRNHRIRFKRQLSEQEVEFLYKKMRTLAGEYRYLLEYKFKVDTAQNESSKALQ